MTAFVTHLWWSEPNGESPPDSRWEVIGPSHLRGNPEDRDRQHHLPYPVPAWAEDLYRVAKAVYVTDKHVFRMSAPDRWTRQLRLSVPVEELDRWRDAPVRSRLLTLLQLLTGDMWEVEFRHLHGHAKQPPVGVSPRPPASEVALFSGGLDSLSWAATRARVATTDPLLLVIFDENQLGHLQRQALSAVARLADTRPVWSLPQTQTMGDGVKRRATGGPLSSRPRHTRIRHWESSTRTRGLLYAAGALQAAAGHRVSVVHIPENGQVALNPPLSAARSAACSTRSVHPRLLWLLNTLLASLDDAPSPLRVVNPLGTLTKGEVCQRARGAGLTGKELKNTLSCGRPPVRQRGSSRFANCGVCFPCLVRRSGLRANGVDDTPYAYSPWAKDLPNGKAEDWRALQRWLLTPYTLTDLLTDIPLPPDADPRAAFRVISRGRMELAQLLPEESRQDALRLVDAEASARTSSRWARASSW